MRRRRIIALCVAAWIPGVVFAGDPGREGIGVVKVDVYYATNGDPAAAGEKSTTPAAEVTERLSAQEALKFEHYRLLGTDRKPVYRSYENWAQPINGTDEVLCRFEVASRVSAEALRLDLELWLSRKKILKSGVVVRSGKPVLVLGPEWRDGRLIISVELAPGEAKAQ